MEELISVIIPVYNVEKYLKRCVESVINQTYTNIEIILVNDGSKDDSGKMCDEYKQKDNRIKVIHKENGGLSSARNCGIEIMSGSYVTFIDSDDYVCTNYVEQLHDMIVDNNCDLSMISYGMIFDEEYSINEGKIIDETIVLNRKSTIIEMMKLRSISQMAWGKLYKSNLFKEIRYPVGKLYEDLAVIYDILLLTDKIAYNPSKLYKYYIREGSIMQSEFDPSKYYEIELIDKKMDMIERIYPDLLVECNERRLRSYFKTIHRIMSSKNKRKYKFYTETVKKKIRKIEKGMLFNSGVSRSIKIKIISFKFGANAYEFVQKISDERKQRRAGYRYII